MTGPVSLCLAGRTIVVDPGGLLVIQVPPLEREALERFRDSLEKYATAKGVRVVLVEDPLRLDLLRPLLEEALVHLEDPSRFWGDGLAEDFFQRARAALEE